MTLIDGDRIITAQLYNDEYEEFTEKKMSIIDYINAYTDEGVTTADIVEQTRWIPVSERLPEKDDLYLINFDDGEYELDYFSKDAFSYSGVIAWMPLPKPYEPQESEEVYAESNN